MSAGAEQLRGAKIDPGQLGDLAAMFGFVVELTPVERAGGGETEP